MLFRIVCTTAIFLSPMFSPTIIYVPRGSGSVKLNRPKEGGVVLICVITPVPVSQNWLVHHLHPTSIDKYLKSAPGHLDDLSTGSNILVN